jgi:hypothetical protein
MDELAKRYRSGQVDWLDGVTVGYKDWWFNCRPSNTEPLLRLIVEAKTGELLREKLAEIEGVLGPPVASTIEPPIRHEKPAQPQQKQPEKKPGKKRKTTRK